MHRSPSRWADLYAVALRLVSGEAHLLEIESDPAVLRLNRMAQQVRRDIHKMHAFVRFRRITVDGVDRYVAWHRPDHLIVREAARFFVDRFASMQWSILTPDACAHWDGTRLRFTAGAEAPPAIDDPTEDSWRAYYRRDLQSRPAQPAGDARRDAGAALGDAARDQPCCPR